MNSKSDLLFAWQFKGDSQILRLYRCGLQVRLFKVYLQSKPSPVVMVCSDLSQFPIQVRFSHQSMANHRAFRRNYKFICNMKYSLILFLPWLFDRACDDTNFSVIFVTESLERFVSNSRDFPITPTLYPHWHFPSLCFW